MFDQQAELLKSFRAFIPQQKTAPLFRPSMSTI